MTNSKQQVAVTVVQWVKLLLLTLKCHMRVCLRPSCSTFNSGSQLRSSLPPSSCSHLERTHGWETSLYIFLSLSSNSMFKQKHMN